MFGLRILILLFQLSILNAQTDDTNNQNEKKPNIMLILADDVGQDDVDGYWGTNIVEMPNIRRLQSKGVTFMDAHASPLCAPSRYMLLSGNYQHRGEKLPSTWNFFDGRNQFRAKQKSLPELLRRDGNYHTAMFGKWHIGLKLPGGGTYNKTNLVTGSNSNWSEPVLQGPNDSGFDYSYFTASGIQEAPYTFFRNGYLETDLKDIKFWGKGQYMTEVGSSHINRKGEGDVAWDSTSYNMRLVNETIAFIDNHLETRIQDPFFSYVALGAVHKPHSPPIHYFDGSPVAGVYRDNHLDMLHEMDKVIGSLVDSIESRGIANETIIIFSSDNGGVWRDVDTWQKALRGYKGQITEGGHRIPLIFRYDEHFPQGEKRSRQMVGINDIYATLADIVGIKVPNQSAQDSVSFAQYIHSEENTNGLREYLGTWDYKRVDGKQIMMSSAIRKKNLKLIQYHYPALQLELYDLNEDLGERNNLLQKDSHYWLVQEMQKVLKQIGPCPEDTQGKFTLVGGARKGKRKNCSFFKKNPNRCNKYIEGDLYCNSICNRFFDICERMV